MLPVYALFQKLPIQFSTLTFYFTLYPEITLYMYRYLTI